MISTPIHSYVLSAAHQLLLLLFTLAYMDGSCVYCYAQTYIDMLHGGSQLQHLHGVVVQGEGVQVSGSGITIRKTAVRGVDSFGMLCSAHDIGWSDKADGVLVMMPDDAQPGDPCPPDPPKVMTGGETSAALMPL